MSAPAPKFVSLPFWFNHVSQPPSADADEPFTLNTSKWGAWGSEGVMHVKYSDEGGCREAVVKEWKECRVPETRDGASQKTYGKEDLYVAELESGDHVAFLKSEQLQMVSVTFPKLEDIGVIVPPESHQPAAE